MGFFNDKIARRKAIVLAIIIISIAFMADSCQKKVHSAEITPPADLYKGIIGEAVGEGYEGMYAVACVYRNRLAKGLPLGCVAMKRPDLNRFVNKQGRKYEILAKRIIHEVFINQMLDVSKGATHYENVSSFGRPFWAKDMKITARIGKHTFYREKR